MFLRTASRIAARDLRASPAKFLFVTAAVAIGVAALTGVKGFGFAFRGMLLSNAKQLIAADLQGQTWNDPNPEQLKKLQALAAQNGRLTRVTETVSMARPQNKFGQTSVPQMVSVKGVDPRVYPFYGDFELEPSRPLASLLADDHSVIVTPELMLRMGVKHGDFIRLGGQDFRIAGTIVTEPDRLASGFGPGMRVMMNRAALERTGLIQFGSRSAQRFLFRLKPDANLDAVRSRLKSIVPRVHITDYREGSPTVGRAIDNTTTFLSLISLIALIVGSLGVAVAMYSHLQQRMDTIAIFKALGARSNQVISVYLMQTLWIGLAGGVLGVAIGALVQRSFPALIQEFFNLLPAVPWDWSFSIQGILVGILATLLFTLTPLLSVRNIRPSLVFRRDMPDGATASRRFFREHFMVIAGAIAMVAGFTAIAAWLSGSWRMGSYFVAGLAISVGLLLTIAAALLAILKRAIRSFGSTLPPWLRHGVANLYRPGSQARSVLVALGVGVMFTLATYLLQNTVLRQVRGEGPKREGNLFLLDVRNTQGVSKLIEGQPGVTGKLQLVGYIVSRMLSKNGIPTEALPLSRRRKDQAQVIRINTAEAVPKDLEVRQGKWWPADSKTPQLAVSEQAAHDFNLALGDRLEFQVAGRTMVAPLVAIFRRSERSPVRYDLVFPRSSLQGLPVVYYGAAHVDPKYIPEVEKKLFEKFPTVTVMNLADILTRVQQAIDQVALVVRFLAGFAIFAGIVILSSSVAGTRYRRIREVAILKTLGGTRGRIRGIFSVEFTILGLVAGLIGGLLANLFTRIVAERFLGGSFDFDALSILAAMLGTAILANIGGWLASFRILDQRPLQVLRGE